MYIDKKIAIGVIAALIVMNLICITILSLPDIFIKASEISMQQEYIFWILLPSVIAIMILFSMRKDWK